MTVIHTRPATTRLSDRELKVTRHLLMHGPSSRGNLGKVLQLSEASMSRLARTLVDGGMVVEDAEPEQGIGRPRQILSAAPGARHVVGVKLTGDVAYAVACDLLGTVLHATKAPLPAPDGDGVAPLAPTIKAVARLAAWPRTSIARMSKRGHRAGCAGR